MVDERNKQPSGSIVGLVICVECGRVVDISEAYNISDREETKARYVCDAPCGTSVDVWAAYR